MTLSISDLQVVLIDDDATLLKALSQALNLEDIKVVAFSNPVEALATVSDELEGVVISDIRMPQMDGLDLFKAVHAIDKDIPVMLITGHADVPMVLSSLREGVFDFLAKPINTDDLIASTKRALETRRLVLENRALKHLADRAADRHELIGDTAIMRQLRTTIQQIASSDIDVLIEGETGTGKDTIAEMIHRGSKRARKALVKVNCTALADDIYVSELVGSASNSIGYTRRDREGLLQRANHGTLYLDDIDGLSETAQGQLLPIIDTRQYRPPGGLETIDVKSRIIASSQNDLVSLVDKGQFRSDLYYRLHTVSIRIPPLRERREDIPLLFAHFLDTAAKTYQRKTPSLSARARRHLSDHLWPGNLRELKNFAQATVLGLSSMIDEPDCSTATLPQQISTFEEAVIRSTLLKTTGDVKAALELLGIPRKTFYDKINRHQINLDRYRKATTSTE